MVLDILAIVAGLAGLLFGGEWLVRAASRLATSFGVSALVVGLTVVAVGTSMPELVVGISAALQGSSDIVVGNVVGSNIANIGLILGLAGLIAPLSVHITLLRREIPVMIVVTVISLVLVLDGMFGALEGFIFMIAYAVFTYVLYRFSDAPSESEQQEISAEVGELEGPPPIKRGLEVLILLAGLALLVGGAQLTVTGALNIARALGISELVIGLTLVAVGTSLPEIATSLIASYRGHNDIAIGNVVGSNIANLLLIMGATSLISPIRVAPEVLQRDFPIAIGFAAVLLILAMNRQLNRFEASILLIAYVGFVGIAFLTTPSAAIP